MRWTLNSLKSSWQNCPGYSIGRWKDINDWAARNFYSVKAPRCSDLKSNISSKATAFWILLITVFKMLIQKTVPPLKPCMNVIRAFVHLKEINGVFPKKNSELSWRTNALRLPIPASMQTSCGYSVWNMNLSMNNLGNCIRGLSMSIWRCPLLSLK